MRAEGTTSPACTCWVAAWRPCLQKQGPRCLAEAFTGLRPKVGLEHQGYRCYPEIQLCPAKNNLIFFMVPILWHREVVLGDLTVKPPETHLAEVRNSRGLAPSVLPVSPLQFQQELRHEAEVGFQHIHHKGASDTLPTEKLKELSLCPVSSHHFVSLPGQTPSQLNKSRDRFLHNTTVSRPAMTEVLQLFITEHSPFAFPLGVSAFKGIRSRFQLCKSLWTHLRPGTLSSKALSRGAI